jgi:hypothetical protein
MSMSRLSAIRRESARRVLWDMREEHLPHLMEDHTCYVGPVVRELVERAGWTYDSYFLAVFFDNRDLLTEIGEGA